MNNEKKQLKAKPRGRPWPKGVSGNLKGRPPGALNKLTQAVKGNTFAVKTQAEPEPKRYDPGRSHAHTMTKIDGKWQRTIEQDGWLFDRETGVEIILPCDTP
jgi:hypothetical protein